MFQSTDASEWTQVKLCAASRGKQQAGCTGGVEAAVGRAAARGFDLLRMAGDVVKQPTEVPHQLAPRFARHGESLENRRRIRGSRSEGELGTQHVVGRGDIEKSAESRSVAGARLLNDVSIVRNHRLERFKWRKGTKRARRMCDVPKHRRVGVDTG